MPAFMGDGKLRRVLRVNPFWRFCYGEEHCKVALLLSALLTVPLRDVIAMSLSSYLPVATTRGIGYALLGACVVPFFVVPFLRCLEWKRDMIFVGAFVLSGLLLFGLRRPEEVNGVYLLLIVKSMLMAFPYYIVARSLKDYALLERALYRASYVINGLVFLTMWHRVKLDGGYSMGAAYAVLPGAIIAFRMLLRRFSFLTMLNAGISFFALVFCGTRGPIVCYVLFCLYEMTINRDMAGRNAIKTVFTSCAIVVTLLAYVTFYFGATIEDIGNRVSYNRFCEMYRKNYLFHTRDREVLWQAAWETLCEYPLTGVGLLEDRVQILQRADLPLKERASGYAGQYSHFVFLDWLVEYGFIAGILISLLALYAVCKILFMPQSSDKSCLEIFFFSGCVPLLFSGIWHEERLFYIVLGMLVSAFDLNGSSCSVNFK